MKFLMLLGTVLTVIVWTQLGVIPGIVCGILFMGGIGWLPIIAVFNVVAIPGSREFIAAWEARHGPMIRHRPDTSPPPGAYRQWRRDRRRSGISAEDWIERTLP